jgi:hypothetical protein
MIRLVIGNRRLRAEWIKIDDVLNVRHGSEEIVANRGAKEILERERR